MSNPAIRPCQCDPHGYDCVVEDVLRDVYLLPLQRCENVLKSWVHIIDNVFKHVLPSQNFTWFVWIENIHNHDVLISNLAARSPSNHLASSMDAADI